MAINKRNYLVRTICCDVIGYYNLTDVNLSISSGTRAPGRSDPSKDPDDDNDEDNKGGLSGGAIAGIVIVVAAVVIAAVGVIVVKYYNRRCVNNNQEVDNHGIDDSFNDFDNGQEPAPAANPDYILWCQCLVGHY